MPSFAPESVRLCTASTTISASSASIMNFDMRSRPLLRPKLHTIKPTTTTSSVHSAISPGDERSAVNTELLASADMPLPKTPVMNLPK